MSASQGVLILNKINIIIDAAWEPKQPAGHFSGTCRLPPRRPLGLKDNKSQFGPAYGTPEQLAELLAAGMEGSGGIGKVRLVEEHGRCLTLCRKADVGWYHYQGAYHATDLFVVVTDRYENLEEGGFDHVVRSAYPVSRFW